MGTSLRRLRLVLAVVLLLGSPGAGSGAGALALARDVARLTTPLVTRAAAGTGALLRTAARFAPTALLLASAPEPASAASGNAWTWGDNGAGQLGLGTTDSSAHTTPVAVHGPGDSGVLTGVIGGALGEQHSLALKGDGSVWAWGSNNAGQLGDGSTTNRTSPVQVKDQPGTGFLTSVTAVAAGGSHSLALRSDRSVWAWGSNSAGQLGDATTTSRTSPVQVKDQPGTGTLSAIIAVAAGGSHSLALKNDGTVWAWGSNNAGQLGDGTTTSRSTPVQVSGLTSVTAIAAGASWSVALKDDGTVWAWGSNSAGQLGDGTTTNRTSPVQGGSLTGVTAIAAGAEHTLAVKSDGSVWAWGSNSAGQLGDDTLTNRSTPVQVKGAGGTGTLGGIVRVAAGTAHSLALKDDGSVGLGEQRSGPAR